MKLKVKPSRIYIFNAGQAAAEVLGARYKHIELMKKGYKPITAESINAISSYVQAIAYVGGTKVLKTPHPTRETYRENLVTAAAVILAEISRIDNEIEKLEI